MDWPEYYEWLMATYWPALPPEQRIESQGEIPEGETSVPDDIWRAAVLMYSDPYAWLNNPIPNLGRRTPLMVIEAGDADAIRAIIRDIAGFMLPSPDEIAPWSEE
jgi:hypothetical protein